MICDMVHVVVLLLLLLIIILLAGDSCSMLLKPDAEDKRSQCFSQDLLLLMLVNRGLKPKLRRQEPTTNKLVSQRVLHKL